MNAEVETLQEENVNELTMSVCLQRGGVCCAAARSKTRHRFMALRETISGLPFQLPPRFLKKLNRHGNISKTH